MTLFKFLSAAAWAGIIASYSHNIAFVSLLFNNIKLSGSNKWRKAQGAGRTEILRALTLCPEPCALYLSFIL
jgi:hypothetical protein